MRKITLILSLLLGAMVMQASELINYSNAYIWMQSARNNSKKGSALATSSGRTWSLMNVINKTDSYDIDFLASYTKTDRKKGDPSHILFAPGNPTLKIDWTPKTGTRPFCDMIATASGEVDDEASLKGWSVRNETKMQRVTGQVNFETATYESIATLNPADFWVKNIQAGDIIAFETAATSKNPGKKGLIKVTAIEDDPDRPERIGEGSYQKLLLDIKIQK